MKIRIPLFFKIVLPLILLIALTVGVSGYRIYWESAEHWQKEMDARLQRVAQLIAGTVNPDLLRQIHLPSDLDNDIYAQVAEPMGAAITAGNLEWVGIYYRQDDHMYYWVDSDSTGVGYPFFYATPEHWAAFADQAVHRVQYTDEFGSYYGFVAPIVVDGEEGPEVLGIVEALLATESTHLLEQQTWNRVLPFLIGGVVLSVGVAVVITVLAFIRPVQRLKRGALALAEGNLGYTIGLKSRDELGDLADTFNRMSAQLAGLYGELQEQNRRLEERVAARTSELSAERNRLDTIVQNVADGLVVTDPQLRITRVNPVFAQSVASVPEQVEGKPLEGVFPGQDLASLVRRSLACPGEVQTMIIRPEPSPGRPADGPVYKASACALVQPDFTAGGAPTVTGAVTVLRDITHETEVDRMKTEFISMVSHELRTPLTSVLGFAKLIGKGLERDILPALPPDHQPGRQAVGRARENLEIIVSEAERLTRLINDVLDIAKMEAGKVEWHMADVAMDEVIRDAAASIAAQAEAKGLPVRVEVEEGLPAVWADRDRMVQLMTNLLANAVKFTDAGEVAVRAHAVQVSEEGSPSLDLGRGAPDLSPGPWLAVRVQDTGCGIPPERLPEVFQKFKQVGDTMAGRPKGTGLGLAICREIVEHHGGHIWVESVPGAGSTFTFVLPLTRVRPVAMEELRRRVVETVPAVEGRNAILVVDDEENIRRLLAEELGAAGYHVLEAVDGLEALERARRDRPALIILDLMMPDMGGLDVLRVLRGDPATAPIPVLILSVLEDRDQGLRLGANEYLTKPVDSEHLLETIAGLLTRSARGEGRKKVLVIDEDAAVIESISSLLRERGYEVVEAGDGLSGLEQARRERPDLIILDAMISRKDNYRVLRALKSESQTREACVIVLAATATPEEMAAWL